MSSTKLHARLFVPPRISVYTEKSFGNEFLVPGPPICVPWPYDQKRVRFDSSGHRRERIRDRRPTSPESRLHGTQAVQHPDWSLEASRASNNHAAIEDARLPHEAQV